MPFQNGFFPDIESKRSHLPNLEPPWTIIRLGESHEIERFSHFKLKRIFKSFALLMVVLLEKQTDNITSKKQLCHYFWEIIEMINNVFTYRTSTKLASWDSQGYHEIIPKENYSMDITYLVFVTLPCSTSWKKVSG